MASENKNFREKYMHDLLGFSIGAIGVALVISMGINKFYSLTTEKAIEIARAANAKETELARIAMENNRIEMERENNKLNVRLNIDKLTYCMQTIMIEAGKSGKFLDTHKAKEICKSAEKVE